MSCEGGRLDVVQLAREEGEDINDESPFLEQMCAPSRVRVDKGWKGAEFK